MIKKIKNIAFALIGVMAFVLTANAATNTPKINWNGSIMTLDQPPVIIDGRTRVPLRAPFEAAGAKVDWEAKTNVVTIQTKEGVTGKHTIGTNYVTMGDATFYGDAASYVDSKTDRTVVPLRLMGNILGADVKWDGANYTVMINKNTVNAQGLYFDPGNSTEVRKVAGEIHAEITKYCKAAGSTVLITITEIEEVIYRANGVNYQSTTGKDNLAAIVAVEVTATNTDLMAAFGLEPSICGMHKIFAKPKDRAAVLDFANYLRKDNKSLNHPEDVETYRDNQNKNAANFDSVYNVVMNNSPLDTYMGKQRFNDMNLVAKVMIADWAAHRAITLENHPNLKGPGMTGKLNSLKNFLQTVVQQEKDANNGLIKTQSLDGPTLVMK